AAARADLPIAALRIDQRHSLLAALVYPDAPLPRGGAAPGERSFPAAAPRSVGSQGVRILELGWRWRPRYRNTKYPAAPTTHVKKTTRAQVIRSAGSGSFLTTSR